MNNKIAKQLREIIGELDNPISRRVYRRLKKEYSKLPQEARPAFIEMSKETLNGKEK